MRRVSEKRAERRGERDLAVDRAFAREGWRCVARDLVVDLDCRGQLDAHEIVPRSAWADGVYDPDNIVPVCRAHHDWITNHESEAHALGLHRNSWERNTG